ncbi:MAG: SufD family Fe-S cluster assembly protein [Cyanobium sp. M30B3]|nr:MAG: SufD family Fe-S cluster assembly protein [Cyanobium sp. M30B3]
MLASATATAPLGAAAAGPASGTAAWLACLAGSPLPSRRQEDWRFTDLAPLTAIEPQLLRADDPLAALVLPAGVERISPTAAEPWQGQALAATGCADHWPVRLNAGARQEQQAPLVALRVSGAAGSLELPFDAGHAPGLAAFRLLLVLEAGASLELLLRPTAAGANALSIVGEVILETGAELKLGSLALGAPGSCLLHHTAVLQAAGSRLEHTAVGGGWALARQEPRILQRQGAARTRLRALQVCRERQLADTHSWVRFDGPEGELDQLHKAVADDQGRSVFNGAVRVPRAAQRTNAAQLSRSLLLSDRARIDTKPELEIVADDVKCAHGATVSRLQLEELFYLQSRGIAADQAAQLLQRAFCEEVLRQLPASAAAHQPLRHLLGEA